MRLPLRSSVVTFLTERGTHLAAMVAYFALLSFVPLIFLALALLGLFQQADESSTLVGYLEDVFPSQPVEDIVAVVAAIQRSARTLGLVGAVGLLWSSVSLFSALESAFNVVYGRPNRPFLRGKALAVAYMVVALVVLFSGLVAGTFGHDLLRRYAPDFVATRWFVLVLTALASATAIFLFLLSAYYRLTNARVTFREVLPGALVGTAVLVPTLQALPLFVWVADDLLALQALGATFLLLVWFWIMAIVVVWGAALNWQIAYGATGRPVLAKREPSD